MVKLADEFSVLSTDYQEVLKKAQETQQMKVTPLQELKGGQTGANLFLVSVSPLHTGKLQHLVLKLDRKNPKIGMDELERHRVAVNEASADFVRNHIPELGFDRFEYENSVAIFYNIAGQSLHNFKPLASYEEQKKIEKIFKTTNDVLLNKWNANPHFEQAVHPQKVLETWLGYRLKPGGNTEKFLAETCRIDPDTMGLLIEGTVYPNPLFYARRSDPWGSARTIDIMKGFQHGDLNIGNILAKFEGKNDVLKGYYLIDFALFKAGMPLFYDHLYLQMSYLLRELSRIDLSRWIRLVSVYAEKDFSDPHHVPVELSGAASVMNTARTEFDKWVRKFHSSLSDDLWGQYWLAGVAVGINYCNKTVISDTERMSGLVFAAVHLKRYHQTFGISPPHEVIHLEINSFNIDSAVQRQRTTAASAGSTVNLPPQPASFIGREEEMTAVKEFLNREDLRILTLTGPGGTGKTSLAVRAAAQLADRFPDGIYFVDLAPVSETEAFLMSILRATGLKEISDHPLMEELGRKLNGRRLLLILDNFEQLIPASGQVVELLNLCTGMKLLITSREALHVRGEQVFPVSPLALPDVDPVQGGGKNIARFASVQLFLERASAVRPDFKLTEENASVIAGICSRLDGLPLAIELAAARIGFFSPQELLERLDHRLRLLRGGARDLPLRQQTLESTIDWSYALLNSDEKRVFAMFSVFQSCALRDIETVGGQIKEIEESSAGILDVLLSLVDKSLVRRIGKIDDEKRLIMLETIRDYATERLSEDPDFRLKVQREHAVYYAGFSAEQRKRLTGELREAAMKAFEMNFENVRVAWRYWMNEGDFEQLQLMTDSLWLLLHARGWYSEIVELTTDLLHLLGSTPSTPERSRQEIMLQTTLGRVMMAIKGCTPEVEGIYHHALDLCSKYGEIPNSFPILRALASFYVYLGDMERCMSFGKKIMDLAITLDERDMKVEGFLILGYCTAFTGDIRKGLELLEQGIALYDPANVRSQGFRVGSNPVIICYTTSALCSWMTGNPLTSLRFKEKAQELVDKLNHPSSKIYALFHIGLLHHYRREDDQALTYAEAARKIADQLNFPIWKASASCLYGASLVGTGKIEEGTKEFESGFTLYAELKSPPVFWPLLLLMKTGVYLNAGKYKECLESIDAALSIMETAEGNPLMPELYRLKGDVLLRISSDNVLQSETLFRKAMEIAGKHKTTMFELRAAISLSRLWISHHKLEESRLMLKTVRDKFTEDFETIELKETRELLKEIT